MADLRKLPTARGSRSAMHLRRFRAAQLAAAKVWPPLRAGSADSGSPARRKQELNVQQAKVAFQPRHLQADAALEDAEAWLTALLGYSGVVCTLLQAARQVRFGTVLARAGRSRWPQSVLAESITARETNPCPFREKREGAPRGPSRSSVWSF